jgi:hypothetical protein
VSAAAELTFPVYHANHALEIRQFFELALQYDLVSLEEACKRRVVSFWPTTVQEWYAEEERIAYLARQHQERHDARPLDQFLPEPASALELAIDYRISPIIPGVISTLARIPEHRIWTTQDAAQHIPAMSNPAYRGARWDLLSEPAEELVRNGRADLCTAIADLHGLLSPYTEHTPDCVQSPACARAPVALLLELSQLEAEATAIATRPTPFRHGPQPVPGPCHDAFTAYSLFNPEHLDELGFSRACRTYLVRHIATLRDNLWRALAAMTVVSDRLCPCINQMLIISSQ